jgi:hypothetical protein
MNLFFNTFHPFIVLSSEEDTIMLESGEKDKDRILPI